MGVARAGVHDRQFGDHPGGERGITVRGRTLAQRASCSDRPCQSAEGSWEYTGHARRNSDASTSVAADCNGRSTHRLQQEPLRLGVGELCAHANGRRCSSPRAHGSELQVLRTLSHASSCGRALRDRSDGDEQGRGKHLACSRPISPPPKRTLSSAARPRGAAPAGAVTRASRPPRTTPPSPGVSTHTRPTDAKVLDRTSSVPVDAAASDSTLSWSNC